MLNIQRIVFLTNYLTTCVVIFFCNSPAMFSLRNHKVEPSFQEVDHVIDLLCHGGYKVCEDSLKVQTI